MKLPRIVPDSNIFIKLLLQEPDSAEAVEFIQHCAADGVEFFVPEHFVYEIANVCVHYKRPVVDALTLFERHQQAGLQVIMPSKNVWLQAEKICQSGHVKSGFPALYDAIFHALAVELGAVFVTADSRHIAKSSKHGAVCALCDWRTLFPTV
jgi:predicted nucleic acid-binding protein